MAETLLLAGCGKMGGALLDGWLDRGLEAADVTVVEPHAATAEATRRRHGVAVIDGPEALDAGFRPATVVFAVKPQSMDDVAPAYAGLAGGETVFLSIAAGKAIAYFEDALGQEAAIVRAMPNTPAAVRRGITVACANARVGDEQIERCDRLLAAVGEVAWIDDEGLMDSVTAVSGSGPAYVFLLAECLAEAGAAAGLPAELSQRLARATVAGSGELLHQADESADTLRANVTSPGGTTAAALDVLMGTDGLKALLTKAIAVAAKRSRELGG
ncbi:MAG: pyrroline-5-carboxylate reductase [Rhodospirillales bacterium]